MVVKLRDLHMKNSCFDFSADCNFWGFFFLSDILKKGYLYTNT